MDNHANIFYSLQSSASKGATKLHLFTFLTESVEDVHTKMMGMLFLVSVSTQASAS